MSDETRGIVKRARQAVPVRRQISREEWLRTARDLFGDDPLEWRFQCPNCGTSQSGNDLLAAGVSRDELDGVLAFSCIGRFESDQGCNWTLGGLFRIHDTEVVSEGVAHAVFDFAEEGGS